MIEIIPAIDIIDGKCVRLTQGDYAQKTVYNENPLEVAKIFEDAGLRRLHIVDLDGARSSHIVNAKIVESIASRTNLTIDFGGGIKSDQDVKDAFNAGAAMITVGSVAVKEPDLFNSWIKDFGGDKIILGADVRNGFISINGWTEDGDIRLMDFIKKYSEKGINKVLCTDISKDGMMKGPSLKLYSGIMEHFGNIHLIASGGVSSIEDIEKLESAGIPAVVFGKAIYEGCIKLNDLRRFIC
jgi:phosphoribosylformimino-5-aminoimidazole carboxamide ribotide isomerase